jgi:hypothetical protein
LVELTDPATVTRPASVTMTAWRNFPEAWTLFLRAIDLSGLAVELLPDGATLKELVWLEWVVVPTGLRKLPRHFFRGCWRLASIDTRHTALEEIEYAACEGCKSLVAFAFPPTVRVLGYMVFAGTAITTLDLSGTVAENVSVCGLVSLVELVLPRRCILDYVAGVPSLRRVTFGARAWEETGFAWHPTEVRFEDLVAEPMFSRGLLEARVYGEVACEMGCETLRFQPQ